MNLLTQDALFGLTPKELIWTVIVVVVVVLLVSWALRKFGIL